MASSAIILLGFAAVLVVIGLYCSKQAKKNTANFFLSGRGNTEPYIAAGHVMGWVGSGTLVGVYGNTYLGGLGAGIWYPIGFSLSFFFFAFVMAKRIHRIGRKRDVYTQTEILRKRFSIKVCAIYSVLYILQEIAYVAGQYMAVATVLLLFFNIPFSTGIIITSVIVLIYVSFGGLKGTLANSLIQMGIVIIGLIFAVIIGTNSVGGFSNLMAALPADWEPNPLAGKSVLALLSGALPTFLMCFQYNAMFIRTFSARDEQVAFRAANWAGVCACLITGLTVLGIFVAVVCVPGLEKGSYALFELFSVTMPLMSAVFAAAVLSACLSTAAECLLASVSIYIRDFHRVIKPDVDEKDIINISRIGMLVMTVIAVFIGLKAASILSLFYFAATMITCMCPVFIGCYFWKRVNDQGAMAGVLAGSIVAIIWYIFPTLQTAIMPTMFAGLIASIIFMFIFTYLFPPPSEEKLAFILPMQDKNCE